MADEYPVRGSLRDRFRESRRSRTASLDTLRLLSIAGLEPHGRGITNGGAIGAARKACLVRRSYRIALSSEEDLRSASHMRVSVWPNHRAAILRAGRCKPLPASCDDVSHHSPLSFVRRLNAKPGEPCKGRHRIRGVRIGQSSIPSVQEIERMAPRRPPLP